MENYKGIWFVLATAVISGFSIFLNKFGVKGFDASVFTFLKNLAVGILLIGLLMFANDFKILKQLNKKQWTRLALIGLLGGSIPFLLFFNGLAMTNAPTAGFIHKTMFIWIAVISIFVLKEKLNKTLLIAAACLLTGNFLLLKLTGLELGIGALMIFAATLFWAIEILLSKSVLNVQEIPGRVVACGRMTFGALFLLVFVTFTGKASAISSFSSSQFLWILFTSILLFGYVLTFYTGLKTISPVTASIILLLGSPITTLLKVAFAGAVITPQQLFGILLIFTGVCASLAGTGYFAYIFRKMPWKVRA